MTWVDVGTIKLYLGITNATDDGLLAMFEANAEAWIESYCGRRFTLTNEWHEFDHESVDGKYLWLDDDLYSVGDVLVDEMPFTQYTTQPRNRPPYFALVAEGWFGKTIKVNGQWGYSPQPPNDIKQAALRLVGYMYRQRDAQSFDVVATAELGVVTIPKGMPKDVVTILERYRRIWA